MTSAGVPPARDLVGQVALVTGAAQGLGLAMAHALAERGAHVVLGDLQFDKAAAAAAEFRTQGLNASACALNIADSEAVDLAFEQVVAFEQLVAGRGRIDIVVNNAGVGQNIAPIAELTDAEWQRVIGITLTGTFYCCRAAARIMRRQESGAIVNIASINGQNPAALVAAYNVAKAGVISLSQTLALELAAYNVRVNVVCPGPVYTEFNKSVMAQRCESLNLAEEQMIERVRAAIPLGRWGEATDIAAAVVFLASPQSAWITGEVLRVSGGLAGVSAAPPKSPKP